MISQRPFRTDEINQIQKDKNLLVKFLLSAFNSQELRRLVPEKILYRMPDSFGIIPEIIYTLSTYAIWNHEDPNIISIIFDRCLTESIGSDLGWTKTLFNVLAINVISTQHHCATRPKIDSIPPKFSFFP